MFKKLFGPSTLVTAAFIGPGTLTACTLAGVKTGYELLWVMVLSVFATMTLQEMAARLGLVTGHGLGEAIRHRFVQPIARLLVFSIVIGAIMIGNAAYEAGNLAGGVLGISLVFGERQIWPIVIGAAIFALLFFGKYVQLERFLITLVILMSGCFLLTAFLVRPALPEILAGMVPRRPDNDNFLLVMALVGTTIVPYNLFLHASTISQKWSDESSLADVRIENAVAVLLGGVISVLIMITAAASRRAVTEVKNAADMAIQLQPLFGPAAKWLMAIGLMAAGVSSALTAPLAAAYAARGIFGWPDNDRDSRFRMVWMLILVIGISASFLGADLILVIKFAQIANAIALPFVAAFLLYLLNSETMERHTNGLLSNFGGLAVVCVTLALSAVSLWKVYEWAR